MGELINYQNNETIFKNGNNQLILHCVKGANSQVAENEIINF